MKKNFVEQQTTLVEHTFCDRCGEEIIIPCRFVASYTDKEMPVRYQEMNLYVSNRYTPFSQYTLVSDLCNTCFLIKFPQALALRKED